MDVGIDQAGQQEPTSKPNKGGRPRLLESPVKMSIYLPKRLLKDVAHVSSSEGLQQGAWVRLAIQTAVQAQNEKRALGPLTQLLDRMAKMEKRVGDLYAQAKSIETVQCASEERQTAQLEKGLVRLGESTEAIGISLKEVESTLYWQRMLVAALIMGGAESVRKALNKIMEDPNRVGKLVAEWRNS